MEQEMLPRDPFFYTCKPTTWPGTASRNATYSAGTATSRLPSTMRRIYAVVGARDALMASCVVGNRNAPA